MITDPRFAPRRNDLPWLRRRHAPKAAVREAATSAPTPAAAPPPVAEFLAGHTHGERHRQPPPAPPTPPVAPVATPAQSSSSLDLDEPSPASRTAPAPPTPSSSSLDLDEPAAAPPSAATPAPSTSSLDLDEPTPFRSTPVAPTQPSSAPARRRRTDVRVAPGERLILTPSEPTATLTRLQTGIGTLTIEAAVSDEVGDLRLGVAYELASDLEMIMQMTQGPRLAPPGSKRPVILGSRERFERVSIDLRQCRELRRMVVYAFSESRKPLTWGGTLVVTTFGGGRIEVRAGQPAGW